MKKSALLLFSGLLLMSTPSKALVTASVLSPFAAESITVHNYQCTVAVVLCASGNPVLMAVNCPLAALCPIHFYVTMWIDPALVIATGLDLAATYDQQEKTIDATDAINELEESLKGSGDSGSGSGSDSGSTDSSLSEADLDVLAPELVVKALNKSADFDAVREAVENYSFETTDSTINGECKSEGKRTDGECATERQNVWTLLSVTLGESIADKLLAKSSNMSGRYSALVSDFNGQSSPMGLWGAMNSITVDTHRQVNDINGLYARALEMNALATLNESGVKKYDRSGSSDEEE